MTNPQQPDPQPGEQGPTGVAGPTVNIIYGHRHTKTATHKIQYLHLICANIRLLYVKCFRHDNILQLGTIT